LRIGTLSLVSILLIFADHHSAKIGPVLSLIIHGPPPLALVGAVFAMRVTAERGHWRPAIAFITLAVISTRNGILKIKPRHQPRAARGRDVRPQDDPFAGSSRTMDPGAMTALSAGLALVPNHFRRSRWRGTEIPRACRGGHFRRADQRGRCWTPC